jgi:hypothetical protein
MAAPTRGTVLAGRYKILETIEAGTFRGHDLALDQTVMVRQASLKTQGVAEFWHQKAQQLALIRDPNFQNVLDVVSENSNEFIITEWSRGRSLGDLLRGAISITMGGRVESITDNCLSGSKEFRTITPDA